MSTQPLDARPRIPPLAWWIVALCAGLSLGQLLCWAFLALTGVVGLIVGLSIAAAILAALACQPGFATGPVGSARVKLGAASLAVAIFVLGGGGGLFYANTDWQVRGAVLRDLTLWPWPFVYDVAPTATLLRAPIGMYLAPALVGKLVGITAADWALVVQNSAFLAILMLLAASLFTTGRARIVAILVFFGFSGLDVVGTLAVGLPLQLMPDRWNVSNFGSNLDGAFATPQHALAAWTGALLYLLWLQRRIPLVALLAPLPLLALWSPFAVMGMMPFAAHGAWRTIAERRLRAADVALPAATTVFALPSLLYLGSGSGAVGGGTAALTLSQYVSFETFEVGPYLLALAFLARRTRFGGATLAIVAVSLLSAPLLRVGIAGDFTMRASMPALAVLCIAIADVLARPAAPADRLWRVTLIVTLLVGSVTPATALYRAIAYPPRPVVLCSYYGVVPAGYAAYVAPLSAMSRWIAPERPARIVPHDPARCWSGPWPDPYEPEFPERVAPADRAFPERLR